MREVNAAGAPRLLLLTSEAIVSGALFVVIVFTEEVPTADTPILPAPGSRVTACLLDNRADMEVGIDGSVTNLTLWPLLAAGFHARFGPVVGVNEFRETFDSALSGPWTSRDRWIVNSLGVWQSLEARSRIYAAISVRSLGILLKYSGLASSFPTSFLADPLPNMDLREALVDS